MPPSTRTPPTRPSIRVPHSGSPTITSPFELYSDSRTHGYQGPTRAVCLPQASTSGGGAVAKGPDGKRCVVAGRESLRIVRVSETSANPNPEHKFAVGKGGCRIDASRNMWTGSGLKIDSAITDVAWGHKTYDNKLLTSARNGELIVWDLNKSGPSKYERRTKDHTRAINKISYSRVTVNYCISGSSDGDLRVWDLRDMTRSIVWLRHPSAIRTLIISPCTTNSLHAITGLDNGSIYRWDLRAGQKGQLDRLPVVHLRPILALDWKNSSGVGGGDGGWLASAGLDRCVKVWDLSTTTDPGATVSNANSGHIPAKPTYTLQASFPIRRISWRPGYETELAVASNNEFGFHIASNAASVVTAPSSTTTEGTGLLSNLSLRAGGSSTAGSIRSGVSLESSSTSSRASDGSGSSLGHIKSSGDMVEIWDVRRSYIAKWLVEESCVEGGITDMTFNDSHALWTHHPSGAFSQLDLRHCTKPIDLVPRAALTWDANGSITFVSDCKEPWEIPYDDIDLSLRSPSSDQRRSIKKLGDTPYVPESQNMGTCTPCFDTEDLQALASMARSYRIEGGERTELCETNAEAAFDAGQFEAGQTWLLLQSLLTNSMPDQSTGSTKSSKPPSLPHSLSAPTTTSKPTVSPPKAPPARSFSSDAPVGFKTIQAGPENAPEDISAVASPVVQIPSIERHSTPTSPLSPSYISFQDKLHARTPGRPKSRRQSSVSILPPVDLRRPTLHRTSMSNSSVPSENLSDTAKSHASLRHVGEGALDDSDSSDANGSNGENESADDEDGAQITLPLLSKPRTGRAMRSPLSREDNDWAEDEREEDSVSPGSSETDSDDSSTSNKPMISGSSKRNVRSRSSTMASLSASLGRRSLIKQESHSSIRTVTAGDCPPVLPSPSDTSYLGLMGGGPERPNEKPSPSQQNKRRRSQAFSVASGRPSTNGLLPEHDGLLDISHDLLLSADARFLDKNEDSIRKAEGKYREVGWASLRAGLEYFANAGDVQMCAMLSCIAPVELHITEWRAVRFVEAYIELLSRLRLHTAAAYLRKHFSSIEVRQSTQLQTTISTVCGKCRKPVLQPAFNRQKPGRWEGSSYCHKCKQSVLQCSVCHLPVRTLLFVCPVCSHGGHQECYRRFYMEHPMTDLFFSPEGRGRSAVRGTAFLRSSDDDGHPSDGDGMNNAIVKVVGHPCAAGCGHYCWAANEKIG